MKKYTPMPNIKAVFFDMDGTLFDTTIDLVNACNQVLQQNHKEPLTLAQFETFIHKGTETLLQNSFGITSEHPDYESLKKQFLAVYLQNMTQNTQLFPGIPEVLEYLEQKNIVWGIVTNRYYLFAKPLVDHFALTERSCCLIGCDTVPYQKPHPAPLLHACELAQIEPAQCVYIGDFPSDAEAAKKAGMYAIASLYGYCPADNPPEKWPCPADHSITSPLDLLKLL